MLTLLIATAVGAVALRLWGGQLLSVQTASMVPTIAPKDAVLIRRITDTDLRTGDIISYRDPISPRVVITHRLIAVNRDSGQLTTAGDALRTSDPSFPSGQVIGKAVALAPKLGFVIDALRRPEGLIFAIYLPAVIVLVAESIQLARAYARPIYSVRL